MRIVRQGNGRNRKYVDLDTDERIRGVTTHLDQGLPKKPLMNWNAEATAAYAIDHWDELAALPPSARLARLKRGRYEAKDEAANRGTQVHKMGERLLNGESVVVPDLLKPYVDSYVRFMDEFQLRATYVETLVLSNTHRYIGIFDVLGDLLFPDLPEYDDLPRDADGFVCDCLIDAKTNRAGVFGETALQLAGLRFAEFLQPDPDDPDTVLPMPDITWTGAVWIRPDGYSLIPLIAGEDEHRTFLYAQQIGIWDQTSRDLVGEPIEPPTASRFALVKVEEDQP
jgi:hypothetical protein